MKRTPLMRKTPLMRASSLQNRQTLKRSGFASQKAPQKPKRRVKRETKSDQIKKAIAEIPYYTKIENTTGRYTGVKGKAWQILSEYVRMRDWIKWRVCVSCNSVPRDWRHYDAGHYISMGGHGVVIGFYHKNIHAQCPTCNINSSQHTGANYKQELIRRGIDPLELERVSQMTAKADDWYFLEKIKEIYGLFIKLKQEHPEYDYPAYLWESHSKRDPTESP